MVYGRYISYVFGISEERTGQKKICEEIIFENFPRLITDIKLKNQEAQEHQTEYIQTRRANT